MKYYSTLLFLVFFVTFSAFSQEKVIKYTVANGETINQIAVKFKVTPYDIYALNPDARSGVKPNTVLLIPTNTAKSAAKSEAAVAKSGGNTKEVIHEVQPKETFYSIEKKYGISDDALKAANPVLEKTGVQIGQKLVIPAKGAAGKSLVASEKTAKEKGPEKYVYHDVIAKETKFSIAKQYSITIEELEKRNPEIVSSLPIGYRLTIKGKAPKTEASNQALANTAKPAETKKAADMPKKPTSYMDYQVKPKETFYSLSRTFHLSQEELTQLNPALAEGVKEGMVLKVPTGYLAPSPIIAQQQPVEKEAEKATEKGADKPTENTGGSIKIVDKVKSETVSADPEVVELTKKRGQNERQKLVLLLPFNLNKMQNDTTSTANRIKNDKFLNMTLDFYSGAMMAIDSARTLKLPIDVAIYDSQETKTASNVSALISQNKLQDTDAVIGPFYQNNAESTANTLRLYNIPVISPLSKDKANPIDNLYQTIPSNEVVRNAMFEYMRSKNGNIVAVVDKKKESVISYIKQNQKGVVFAALTETGALDVANLKGLLLPNRVNYVVMETGNTAMVKTTIKALSDAQKTCQVQLVILEPNSTLDTDEISFDSLVKLKLMYPSVTRESDEPGVLVFEKEYRLKNKVNPNTYATRGFDVTFDTMMRLVQGKTYQETADLMTTEQVDNKFQFYKKEDGGHANKGVYILYYDSDLTLKVAN
ncbi:amino acid/amide ABC transporter substrate-binding protein (HAAT family) [Flavobacterium araucananum]|uniref:amino acid ABC transporter substrate-binding protein n=1 Tax=Flavobacterium araucananum TaxID=946678 RepID=UPI000D6CA676|nr:LysM peptidoglycan-binding domain-containing protein [Flavobacterium araucananum]PWK00676.1 amino acid/amide ABC transporter substrate-binding protein (HAAT family) [Flavobacterium araucananum]